MGLSVLPVKPLQCGFGRYGLLRVPAIGEDVVTESHVVVASTVVWEVKVRTSSIGAVAFVI